MKKEIGQYIIFSLAAILLIITFCVVFILLSPIYLFRWILSKLKFIFRPDLYKILPATSAMYLQLGIEKEERTNLQITLKLQGKIHHEEFIAKISRDLVNSKSNGMSSFPELKMYAEYWCGFPFWKPESNFKLEDHLRLEKIPPTVDTDNDENFATEYENNLVKIPFKYGKSPWEIVHLEGNNSYVIFKVHHSLTDGHGVFHVLMKCVDNCVPLNISSNPKVKRNLWAFLKYLTFPFLVAFDAVKRTYILGRNHPWKKMVREMCPDSRVIVNSKSRICCENIKDGSKKHGVTFTTILLAGITGGIRHYFENSSQTIPEYMGVEMAIPAATRHPDVLTNHFAIVIVRLPLGETNMSARIQQCQKELDTIRSSKQPALHILCCNIVGALPRIILSNLGDPVGNIGCNISNFVSSTQQVTLLGHPVLNVYFKAWVSNYLPVFMSVLSYNGGIQFVANADPNLFPSEDLLHKLLEEIHKEIDAIRGVDLNVINC